MTPGALLLKLRQKYGHGLVAAHYRDRVRPRILATRPVRNAASGPIEIHVLTSKSDWLNLIWALKSFFVHARRDYPLVIHEDGSLDAQTVQIFRHHFPDARIVRRTEADAAATGALVGFPRCSALRATNTLSIKVFDFRHFLQSERMLLLDSDVLFYAEPAELLRRAEDPGYRLNSVNGDVDSAYTVDPAVVREMFGFTVIERYNSGLGVIHADSMRLDWIEEFLGIPGIIGHHWRIEQTLYALFSSRFGTELLPEDYDVRLAAGIGGRPSRHYVGAIRHLMYAEGMRHLCRNGFLRDLR